MFPAAAGAMSPAAEMKHQSRPLSLKEQLMQPRSIFAPGSRIRMNFVPMVLNLFLPWGVFVIMNGLQTYTINTKPLLAEVLIACLYLFWFASVGLAWWARKNMPEPTWFTYAAVMIGFSVLSGVKCGMSISGSYTQKFQVLSSMKVIRGMDASNTVGQDVMDAGMVFFKDGTHLDSTRSWHFKQRTMYCVAPIVTDGKTPKAFDFWAVGKDCCSMDSSDFRCGAWAQQDANSGIRVLSNEDLPFYRLAVQQAETLYGVVAPHPIFFTWSKNAESEVEHMFEAGFKTYTFQTAGSFIFYLVCLLLATCKFAWIGRTNSTMGSNFGGYAAI